MKRAFLYFFISSAAIFLMPALAHAAAVELNTSGTAVVGQSFRVDVVLDTKGDDVNTVQATIDYPVGLFSLQNVNDGNSIINFWITSPAASSSGEIQFAGIIPGGFTGPSGSLVSLFFTPLGVGSGTISVATATVLRNDGQGSSIPVTLSSVAIGAVPAASGTLPSAPASSLIAPNPFTPEIAQDSNIFGGGYFLVFSTTDKGTGIDHYEVLEVPTGASGISPVWHVAESPYLLEDQSLSSDIYVRAVDHAGNFIVVEVPARFPAAAQNPASVRTALAWAAAIVAVLLFLIWFVRRKRGIS